MRSVRARLTAVTAAPGSAQDVPQLAAQAAASPPTGLAGRLERGGAPRSPALFPRRWRGGLPLSCGSPTSKRFFRELFVLQGRSCPVNRARNLLFRNA